MSIPSWPTTLPVSPLLSSYDEEVKSLTSAVTTGNKSILIRRMSTRTQTPISVAFNFTKNQVAIFETFFYNTLGGGALRFSFTHPRTKEEIEVSFDPSSEVAFKISPQDSMSYFKVSAKFLIWS